MPHSNASLFWTILTAISASAVSLAVVAWLVRSIITHWLSKDIEVFKATLQHAKNSEIEKLRAELGRMTLEHQVKFSQLHTKVFDTIAHLYKLIAKTQRAMASFLTPVVTASTPPERERGQAAVDSWHALVIFFREHEIYFDKETCAMMEHYLQELKKLHIDFQNKQFAHSHVMEWNRIWEELTGNVQSLKQKLADNFRGKIGIEG